MRTEPVGGTPVVTLQGVSKRHSRDAAAVPAVDGVDLELEPGTLHALVGASGSGKSTLLSIVAGHDRPDSGILTWADGVDPGSWSCVASLPQALALMPELTLGENIALTLRLTRSPAAHADALRERLEIAHLSRRYPRQASLGEQQRVALVRALCVRPALLVLDEPTAHQDQRRVTLVRECLSEATQSGTCVLLTSHDPAVADAADAVHVMRDGVLGTRPEADG